MTAPLPSPLPARAGIGLKPQHYADVLVAAGQGAAPAWVEVTPRIISARAGRRIAG